MVVHSGPTVYENCCGQLLHHSPHLAHVLVVNQLVQSRDKLGSEVSAMRQCRFLHTTRFGPDVVASTLCCEEDSRPKLLIVEEAQLTLQLWPIACSPPLLS